MSYSQVLLVDNGGFFPEDEPHKPAAWFLMDAMKVLGTDAVGLGERDLRFGVSFLTQNIKRAGLPVTCANLFDSKTKKPLVDPYIIKQVGRVKVGLFGLISDKANLGPGKDSLSVEEPGVAATNAVKDLRRKGATIVVLLSQLGKVESEDLVASVDGIDAVVVGHNTPLIQKGRMIKNTVACYGGEQGQFICRTAITLDAQGKMASGDAEAFILSPEVGEKADVAELVKSFEEGLNEQLRKEEMEKRAKIDSGSVENSPDHYLGSELCIRCHEDEGRQWKTTAHSVAWQTLVDAHSDANAECIQCHVVGYNQPGGFQNATVTPKLANVQCESCHGMGTKHDAFSVASASRVTQATCRSCHNQERDPDFQFDQKMRLIMHTNFSGETLAHKKDNSSKMMNANGH
jgi:hypothetical protein